MFGHRLFEGKKHSFSSYCVMLFFVGIYTLNQKIIISEYVSLKNALFYAKINFKIK